MRLVLLTDLHFGRASPDLVQPLLDSIANASPDLIVIAGDFVQRARGKQFSAARDFVDRLQHDWIAVPGNHDIPLYNIVARVLSPRAAYRRWIAPDTAPTVTTDDAVIVGLDTTHRWSHQRGLIRPAQIAQVADAIRANWQDRTVVVMAHHPFHQSPDVEKKVMKNAAEALRTWSDCGPHIILSGHLHTWTVEPFIAEKNRSMTLQVHCGTGLSTRLRGSSNEYAILDLDQKTFSACRMVADHNTKRFVAQSQHRYGCNADGWHDLP
ncbi:metallophosphoesterase [Loktanella sp. SALINAS62]|uniref:metallophosphoesterase family protein n=1 Tax=Loktanella sp. SALINAS62 TaxID=2706124 RepID=UPI001B8AD272|nr:metallophosphoesterase [Loktanella sp. SALINAS62]MBS1300963.1 metallophosphoesterase [Loktanella sp. SALINAS62]